MAYVAACEEIAENDYNLSVSTYVEPEDTREKIDIVKLNAEIKEIVSTSRTFSQECRASPVNRRCPAFEEIIRAVCCADDHGHGQQKERETYQH